MMTKEKYLSLKLEVLRVIARDRGISGGSRMRKAELIDRMLQLDEAEGAGRSLADKGQAAFADKGQAALADKGQAALADKGQAAFADKGQAAFADKGQAAFADKGRKAFAGDGQTAFAANGQMASVGDGQTASTDRKEAEERVSSSEGPDQKSESKTSRSGAEAAGRKRSRKTAGAADAGDPVRRKKKASENSTAQTGAEEGPRARRKEKGKRSSGESDSGKQKESMDSGAEGQMKKPGGRDAKPRKEASADGKGARGRNRSERKKEKEAPRQPLKEEVKAGIGQTPEEESGVPSRPASDAKPNAPAIQAVGSAASAIKTDIPAGQVETKPASRPASDAKPDAPARQTAGNAASAAKPEPPAGQAEINAASAAKPEPPAGQVDRSAAAAERPWAPAGQADRSAAAAERPWAPAGQAEKNAAPAAKPDVSAGQTDTNTVIPQAFAARPDIPVRPAETSAASAPASAARPDIPVRPAETSAASAHASAGKPDASASQTETNTAFRQEDADRSAPRQLYYPENASKARGILELHSDGFGFLRSGKFQLGEEDVYVSPSQIRRFNLRTGDVIEGIKRENGVGDKNAALLFVSTVNGFKPDQARRRPSFESMTPVFPYERIRLEQPGGSTATRVVDLISPIGKGQRGMIVSPPKAGKTTLLKDIAKSILTGDANAHLIILLVDERPEEVTDMKESVTGVNVEIIYSTFDEQPEHHMRVAEMVIERAKRLVEHHEDVIILLDSITRLTRAYNLLVPPSGRTLSGGLDPAALYAPKRFFGAARKMREGGSLTILATALVDTGSKMDDVVYEEFKGTGNMELILDRKLQERRIFPAIDITKSGTRREDLLLTPDELRAVYLMRRRMNGAKPEDAIENILNAFARSKSNEQVVESVLAKWE